MKTLRNFIRRLKKPGRNHSVSYEQDTSGHGLPHLPPEIIDLVACDLQLRDLLSLKLTCKPLAEKVSDYVGRMYITKASTNLSFASVQNLDRLSRTRWARHIAVFRLEWDGEVAYDPSHGHDASRLLLPDLPLVQQVRDSLLRFPNCRMVEIRDVEGDFRHVFDQYYCTFGPNPTAITFDNWIGVALVLIAETGLPLETLHIRIGWDGNDQQFKLDQSYLEYMRRPTFKSALSNLKDLMVLCYVYKEGPDWAWNMVCSAPHLQRLDWKATPYQNYYFEPIGLTHLQELTFRRVRFSEVNLIELLERCKHCLRSITLIQVSLDQNWRHVFEYCTCNALRSYGVSRYIILD